MPGVPAGEQGGGRVSVAGPSAEGSLAVVRRFDALVAGRAGPAALARGAAALAGAVAGWERNGRVLRYDADGLMLPPGDDSAGRAMASAVRSTATGAVWVEGAPEPGSFDELIAERLAISMDLTETDLRSVDPLAIVIDRDRSRREREESLTRLGVARDATVRILATEEHERLDARSVVVPTGHGWLRATLDLGGDLTPSCRAGISSRVRADAAAEGWDEAVIALRLTVPSAPVISADEVGAMIVMAKHYDPSLPHPDVRALAQLDPLESEILRLLVLSDSVRSAAAELGMHHSTVQAHHRALTERLGYDPRTTYGHVRFTTAEMLLRLSR